jgi:hypothetical protein
LSPGPAALPRNLSPIRSGRRVGEGSCCAWVLISGSVDDSVALRVTEASEKAPGFIRGDESRVAFFAGFRYRDHVSKETALWKLDVGR